MKIKFETTPNVPKNIAHVCLVTAKKDLSQIINKEKEVEFVLKKLEDSSSFIFSQPDRSILFIKVTDSKNSNWRLESIRRSGCDISTWCNKEKISAIQIWGQENEILALAEGIILSGYSFTKYKSRQKEFTLRKIYFANSIKKEKVNELYNLLEATLIARDLVNEPVIFLSARKFSDEISKLGKKVGFKVEVFNKKKIETLKMGGLLGVNKGSIEPPTFNILEYKPSKAVNKNPIVLVGKGVVYDTGGLSLKDSAGMSIMKCDMAGAAAVVGAFYAAASNQLPVHIIGLIPATDNMPGSEAITPGDIITISNGKTVEVLNTDAEGRLILADALVYASKYKPKLVIDLATLTGAAARAIGKDGIVFMGNAPEKIKSEFKTCGEEVYERLVEFPLWEEYGKQLQSDIADLKNIGEGDASAITAGKFLENFVDYDWLHLDIAGPAFLKSPDFYRSKNATGIGVRLLYQFLKRT